MTSAVSPGAANNAWDFSSVAEQLIRIHDERLAQEAADSLLVLAVDDIDEVPESPGSPAASVSSSSSSSAPRGRANSRGVRWNANAEVAHFHASSPAHHATISRHWTPQRHGMSPEILPPADMPPLPASRRALGPEFAAWQQSQQTTPATPPPSKPHGFRFRAPLVDSSDEESEDSVSEQDVDAADMKHQAPPPVDSVDVSVLDLTGLYMDGLASAAARLPRLDEEVPYSSPPPATRPVQDAATNTAPQTLALALMRSPLPEPLVDPEEEDAVSDPAAAAPPPAAGPQPVRNPRHTVTFPESSRMWLESNPPLQHTKQQLDANVHRRFSAGLQDLERKLAAEHKEAQQEQAVLRATFNANIQGVREQLRARHEQSRRLVHSHLRAVEDEHAKRTQEENRELDSFIEAERQRRLEEERKREAERRRLEELKRQEELRKQEEARKAELARLKAEAEKKKKELLAAEEKKKEAKEAQAKQQAVQAQQQRKKNQAIVEARQHLQVLKKVRQDAKKYSELCAAQPQLSNQKMMLEINVQLPVNQLACTQVSVAKKAQKICQQLKQAAQANPLAFSFAIDKVATLIVKKTDNVVLNKENAFALASLADLICRQFNQFEEILLATLQSECIFCIPTYSTAAKTKMELRRALGYADEQGDDGKWEFETDVKYLDRVYGRVALLTAFMVSPHVQHKYTKGAAWIWLARILNRKPIGGTATALLAFLEMGGYDMLITFPKQFSKIVKFLETVYVPMLPEKSKAQKTAKDNVSLFLKDVRKARSIKVPQGRTLAQSDSVNE